MSAEARSQRAAQGAAVARLVIGLLVLALGVVFLADNLGFLHAADALRLLWPCGLCVIGVAVLVEPKQRGASRYWGLVWIVAGAWIWSYQHGWIDLDFWDLFFPGVLVVVGGSLVWRALGHRRRASAEASDRGGDLRAFALMSGNEVRSAAGEFRGADLGAVMGGVTLDLTQAKLGDEPAEIDVFAIWGGIEIRVPPDWTVISKVVPLMAAFEDKTHPVAGAAAHRLVVRGVVVMGGVEVKN